jgi:hypothetical protein
MPDLADSYCERCGARYVFNPPTPKSVSLKGARVLAKGFKNFVLNDGQSITDSLTQARHEDEHEDSTRVTEAFHRTFNFCMTCRQYACDKCWNARAGACFSCAPEPGFEPTAPEDHLIVRTPVARWDADWSLFPDGPAVEPVSRPDPPAPFNAPIPLPEPKATLPSKAPARAAWPATDLPDGLQTAASGASGKSGHRPSRKPADPAAVGLWPLPDQIAPGMALTPEELDSVESSLGHGGTSHDSAQGRSTTPGSPPIGAPPEPATPDHVAAQDATLPSDWPSLAATWLSPSTPAWEPAASADPATASQPMAQQSIDREQKRSPGEPEPELSPQRILHLAEVAPHPSPPIPQAAETPSREHARSVAKLLGRHGSPIETSEPGQQRRAPARKSQPSGDPWPLATRWTERPVEAGWDEPAPLAEAVAPSAASSPAPARVDAQPTARVQDDFDARSAAAARLSAVEGDAAVPGGPAAQPPIPGFFPDWATSPAPPEGTTGSTPQESPLVPPPAAPEPRQPAVAEPAWPEADREVVEAMCRQSLDTPDQPQIGQPPAPAPTSRVPAQPEPSRPAPAPWPPLGASYPAQADRGAPWPGPDVTPAPAVVVAQSIGAPPLADMWVQSSQEVLNRGTVRVCHHCALPVSTQARFCRRCGTRQG